MKLGTSIWPWKWGPPYDDAITRIARAGFKAVELIAWEPRVFDEYYTPSKIKELRKRIADEGLDLSEFVSTPRDLAHPDKSKRQASVDHFKRMVDTAVALGTKIVNSVAPHPFSLEFPRITDLPHVQEFRANLPSGLDWKRNWEDYVGAMKQCCRVCEQAGVRYALESHPYRIMRNADSMLRLIEHVGSPALGMNLDPSHLFPLGELPEVVIGMLGDRIFHCHFSDNDGVTNAHWRVGRGKVDWKAVMRALKETGFNGVISIELEDAPGGRDEHVPGEKRSAATQEFEEENKASMEHIKRICAELQIRLE